MNIVAAHVLRVKIHGHKYLMHMVVNLLRKARRIRATRGRQQKSAHGRRS